MSEIEAPLYRAGADGVVLEDFRSLRNSHRYPERQVIIPLAHFIVGVGGGPNKDSPLYELCHLICGVGKMLENDVEHRATFFLGFERVTSEGLRNFLVSNTEFPDTNASNIIDDSIRVNTDGSHFHIKFGRMPFLVALYEFLTTMENFEFYAEFEEIVEELTRKPGEVTENLIKSATGKLASRLRLYRRSHLAWAAKQEKFDPIFQFLRDRRDGDQIIINDQNILEFWCLHSVGKDFKGYKTVFDSFITFHQVLLLADRTQSAETAKVIGLNRDAGEIDVADQAFELATLGDWVSPLHIFEQKELSSIKFFKQSSEQKPIEVLMYYGPFALQYPRAFLRLGSFGVIQTGITNDLQLKRSRDSIDRRIACLEAEPYSQKLMVFRNILKHVEALQRAVLHFIQKVKSLSDENVVAFPGSELNDDSKTQLESVAVESERAFRNLKRQGFEEPIRENDGRTQAFYRAVSPLTSIGDILQRILLKSEELGTSKVGLDQLFRDDQEVFRNQFNKIYGGQHEQI